MSCTVQSLKNCCSSTCSAIFTPQISNLENCTTFEKVKQVSLFILHVMALGALAGGLTGLAIGGVEGASLIVTGGMGCIIGAAMSAMKAVRILNPSPKKLDLEDKSFSTKMWAFTKYVLIWAIFAASAGTILGMTYGFLTLGPAGILPGALSALCVALIFTIPMALFVALVNYSCE